MMMSAMTTRANWPSPEALPERPELPDPLRMFDGTAVTSVEQWRSQRRPELISLFEHYMYGKAPPPPVPVAYSVEILDDALFDRKATLKNVVIALGPGGTHPVHLLLMTPNGHDRPAPVFFGLNFVGNHTVLDHPAIPLTTAWVHNRWSGGGANRAKDEQRGMRGPDGSRPRWFLERMAERGYAVATIYAGEIAPDQSELAFREGVHAAYFREGQTRPDPHEWAVIAVWAWGMMRAVDYLVEDADIDADRIMVLGHSRLGKTALLAGALDERIALITCNGSGTGGSAPSRSDVGEDVEAITRRFPHWFTEPFPWFSERETYLPFDQHELIALCAPRPVLLTNGTEDTWADPRGQFNMLKAAAPVYRLHGVDTPLAVDEFPEERVLVDSVLGYHIRPGGHDMTWEEWEAWMKFAERHGLGVRTP